MGCTGEKTYEQAVKDKLRRYLHNYKLSNNQEKEIKNFISQDLTKKAAALNNYQYIYRDEDAQQTAEEYKKLIMEKFRVGDIKYEQQFPRIEEDKENKNNNINNNENNSINNKNNINNINNNINQSNNPNNNNGNINNNNEIDNIVNPNGNIHN